MASPSVPVDALEPLRYQRVLAQELERRAPAAWRWIAAQDAASDPEALRLELLKSCVRLEPEAHARLHAAAAHAAQALGTGAELHLYQSPLGTGLEASLWYLPGEVHLVLGGPVESVLDDAELRWLFGHELAHHRLWSMEEGRYRIVDRLLRANAARAEADAAQVLSAERWSRAVEVWADRAALAVDGELEAAVSCLVKITTGLRNVDALAFVRQAEEVLARDPALSSAGQTHPETFLRARALAAFARGEEGAEARVLRWIEGPLGLERLDLLDQWELEVQTQELVRRLLRPHWMRREALLAHARAFDPALDAARLDAAPDDEQGWSFGEEGQSLEDYLAYLLLDFAALDPEGEEVAMVRCLEVAARLGVEERFVELVRSELGRTKKAVDQLRRTAPERRAALEGKSGEEADPSRGGRP